MFFDGLGERSLICLGCMAQQIGKVYISTILKGDDFLKIYNSISQITMVTKAWSFINLCKPPQIYEEPTGIFNCRIFNPVWNNFCKNYSSTASFKQWQFGTQEGGVGQCDVLHRLISHSITILILIDSESANWNVVSHRYQTLVLFSGTWYEGWSLVRSSGPVTSGHITWGSMTSDGPWTEKERNTNKV